MKYIKIYLNSYQRKQHVKKKSVISTKELLDYATIVAFVKKDWTHGTSIHEFINGYKIKFTEGRTDRQKDSEHKLFR